MMSECHGYRVIAVTGVSGIAGLTRCRASTSHRCHSAVCTEIKKRKTPFGQKRNKALCHKHNMPVSARAFSRNAPDQLSSPAQE
jgi:hypothetical protein